jgi:hypothetical protein
MLARIKIQKRKGEVEVHFLDLCRCKPAATMMAHQALQRTNSLVAPLKLLEDYRRCASKALKSLAFEPE